MQNLYEALSVDALQNRLYLITEQVSHWLQQRRVPQQPFGHFQLCTHAFAKDELNAATAGIELWQMLKLPLSEQERAEAIAHLQSFQQPSGLVIDPSWHERQLQPNEIQLNTGDTFFTMTASAALAALGSHFQYPVHYLTKHSPVDLLEHTSIKRTCHHPYAIGDYAPLITLNQTLGVTGAQEQWQAVHNYLKEKQESNTGLWSQHAITPPYTPTIMRAFHFMRSTWNVTTYPYTYAEQMLETCLAATHEDEYFDWEHGYACTDLDLTFILYSARCWSTHRKEEIETWAKQHLSLVLNVQQRDGGFSFRHTSSMTEHAGIAMSPQQPEGDMWGTLMYMGTIKMLVALAYPGVEVPWQFSYVHRIPNKPLSS